MYTAYWELKENPFRAAVRTPYVFEHKSFREAFSRLRYFAVNDIGLFALFGDSGIGKTCVLSKFMQFLRDDHHLVAYIFDCDLPPDDFLRTVINALTMGYTHDAGIGLMHNLTHITRIALDNNKRTYIIVDEAHIITNRLTFERVRLLLNYKHNGKRLFKIILSGQPPLKYRLYDIPSLWQRIEVHCDMGNLAIKELPPYIRMHLEKAGAAREIFADETFEPIYRLSNGNPREVDLICDLALFVAAGKSSHYVDADIIDEVKNEIERGFTVEKEFSFIGNKMSGMVHTLNCLHLPVKKNQELFAEIADAVNKGYSKCPYCFGKLMYGKF